MHVDCTLFSEVLKQSILNELSEIYNISPEEISLQSLEIAFDPENLNLKFIEKKTLLKALSKSSGNITKIAQLLGVSRKTVYSLIKKHHIVNIVNINANK